MEIKNIYILLMLLSHFLLVKFSCVSQNIVYKDDSLVYNNFSNLIYNFSLKSKLPDGKYYVYDIYRKDSTDCCKEKQIILKGQYENSLKTGRFEYFSYVYSFWKTKRYLHKVENYKEGKKNGHWTIYDEKKEIIREGYYVDGVKKISKYNITDEKKSADKKSSSVNLERGTHLITIKTLYNADKKGIWKLISSVALSILNNPSKL